MPIAHVFTVVSDRPVILQIDHCVRHAVLKNDIDPIREYVSTMIPFLAARTEWSNFSWTDVTHVMVQGGTFPQDDDEVDALVYGVSCRE